MAIRKPTPEKLLAAYRRLPSKEQDRFCCLLGDEPKSLIHRNYVRRDWLESARRDLGYAADLAATRLAYIAEMVPNRQMKRPKSKSPARNRIIDHLINDVGMKDAQGRPQWDEIQKYLLEHYPKLVLVKKKKNSGTSSPVKPTTLEREYKTWKSDEGTRSK
jgi:hypothetical protein